MEIYYMIMFLLGVSFTVTIGTIWLIPKQFGASQISTQQHSDGYHTFEELYYHRMILFSIICNQNKELAWKSLLHDNGTMYDQYFIVGINTIEGQYTYHYHVKYWEHFQVKELKHAPDYDGHQPKDITRLLSLVPKK